MYLRWRPFVNRYEVFSGVLLLFFLFVAFASAPAAMEEGYGQPEEPAPVPVQKQITVIDETAEVPSVDDIIDHCARLPEIDVPKKGCNCLYDAYDTVLRSQETQNERVYEDWKSTLDKAEKKILENYEPSLLMSTQNFCEQYYGNPDHVEIASNIGTRDKAVMTPKFSNKEEKTAFTNAKLELYRATGGTSDLYCRAYFEVRVYERLKKRNPLAGLSPAQAYAKLSRSNFCYARLR